MKEDLTPLKPSSRRVYSYLKRHSRTYLHVLQGAKIGGTAAGTRLSELRRFLLAYTDEELKYDYVIGQDGRVTHTSYYWIQKRPAAVREITDPRRLLAAGERVEEYRYEEAYLSEFADYPDDMDGVERAPGKVQGTLVLV